MPHHLQAQLTIGLNNYQKPWQLQLKSLGKNLQLIIENIK